MEFLISLFVWVNFDVKSTNLIERQFTMQAKIIAI